jgi:hypothetical protein
MCIFYPYSFTNVDILTPGKFYAYTYNKIESLTFIFIIFPSLYSYCNCLFVIVGILSLIIKFF